MDFINPKYLTELATILKNKEISIINDIANNYTFLYFSGKLDIDIDPFIYSNFKNSRTAVIYHYTYKSDENTFFIVSFEKTLIIIDQSSISILKSLFSTNEQSIIYIFSNKDSNYNFSDLFQNRLIENNQTLLAEIKNFCTIFRKKPSSNPSINKLWTTIQQCISGYLISKSYLQSIENQASISSNEIENSPKEIWDCKDYIELREIGRGSSFLAELVYCIEKGQLFIIKKPLTSNSRTLLMREIFNYSKINHSLAPKYHGTVKDCNHPIIQYINGKTLEQIDEFHLNEEEKNIIIFQIMLFINYLHNNNFVYRDLKPDNVMIDENKNVFIIDFDNMIKYPIDTANNEYTKDFSSVFVSPEVNIGKTSYKSDIYSIGQMIYYIIKEKYPDEETGKDTISLGKFDQIYLMCTNNKYDERPSISELMFIFYIITKVKSPKLLKDKEAQYIQGLASFEDKYVSYNVDKAIHLYLYAAEHNFPKCFCLLGTINFQGKYVPQDINKAIYYYSLSAEKNITEAQFNLGVVYFALKDIEKAIHYFTLASDQNVSQAQFYLGSIYLEKNTFEDIYKAIHYFTLAANQNHLPAQHNLGLMYIQGLYVSPNINKSIYYLHLAANQNDCDSQYILGCIYCDDKYGVKDIDKGIYYYTLAAKQNDSGAQFSLALIYYYGEYVKQDINKAIHYLILAADNNHRDAEFVLGMLYSDGKYIKQDIEKAVYYYTLAANQNKMDAQYNLGLIYYKPDFHLQDINKSIYYFKLAANQNHLNSQMILGSIFYDCEYVTRDINKSIYYFELAANQNCQEAQYDLGCIYINQDINKAIYYFSLAANQNDLNSLLNLGAIYYEDKYVRRDIEKAIHYYTLAANQNDPNAQYILGIIYKDGNYVPRDIDKAIYYFQLSADQNHLSSLSNLGYIYRNEKYNKLDINKSIHYFTLAANYNEFYAHFNLAVIYYEGKYVKRNINKVISYLSLAANQNCSEAQYNLGMIYYEGMYVKQDINKAIHYFSLSSNNNFAFAQLFLGQCYLLGIHVEQNIRRGMNYLIKSSYNGSITANFMVGSLFHDGSYIKQDIQKSIDYYKKASSFNNKFAKNNLGVIYKNEGNIGLAISYFEEGIKRYNDKLSMYNLSHIYIYKDKSKKRIDEAIGLLIKLFNLSFHQSLNLLCVALIKKHGFNFQRIQMELLERTNKLSSLSSAVFQIIKKQKLDIEADYNNYYKFLEKIDYIYDFREDTIAFSIKKFYLEDKNIHDISSVFYDGFGIKKEDL